MNKDDQELFAMFSKSETSSTQNIFLISNKLVSGPQQFKVAYTYLKKYGDLSSVKMCLVFRVTGCPYSIIYGSSEEMEPFNVKKVTSNIEKILSDFIKIQIKNLKSWSSSDIEEMLLDNNKYYYCKHLRKEIIPLFKFIHSTMSNTKAGELMTKFNNHKIKPKILFKKFNGRIGGPIPNRFPVPKKFSEYDSHIDKILFIHNAKLVYHAMCWDDELYLKYSYK